jgi:hypothetical protein
MNNLLHAIKPVAMGHTYDPATPYSIHVISDHVWLYACRTILFPLQHICCCHFHITPNAKVSQ